MPFGLKLLVFPLKALNSFYKDRGTSVGGKIFLTPLVITFTPIYYIGVFLPAMYLLLLALMKGQLRSYGLSVFKLTVWLMMIMFGMSPVFLVISLLMGNSVGFGGWVVSVLGGLFGIGLIGYFLSKFED